ncbi:helix-turn-helix transcriptional regulator [Serpentinicella sp. ANB-PHB4]|uniref:helix-turn-helix domain-containing protein n=1 Tax=Serpentinicella sp. ANB-PHB4 TaxID=3074076 RepID=UPI002857E32A|nr:helix-turn-helix transcriptional regulator [Serpentinicella sp. ANB-PHB4]MDR5659257.1 helix-turn-helix transcriptional regulator [Serpentinicella sp. ANB-PHB4]
MMENYNIKILFGSNVRKYRYDKGISQEKLAELSGLHRTYISDVERGCRSISLDNIKKIASALEVKIFKLFVFNEETDHYD